jgi:serine/threonine protein kinase
MEELVRRSPLTVASVIADLGVVDVTFDGRTQDSGHVSYGIVTPEGRKLFVKTPGGPDVSAAGVTRRERSAALRRAVEVETSVAHPALVSIDAVIEAADGVVVLYEWFDGEHLYSPAAHRDDPATAGARFRRLPAAEIAGALDQVIDLHVALEGAGWIAGDLYDGCLMYDFARRTIKVVDFEAYLRGSTTNDTGRMLGSTRFMAPEEHRQGATIDARTTVYNLGRLVAYFLADHRGPELQSVIAMATVADPNHRLATVADLQVAWRALRH